MASRPLMEVSLSGDVALKAKLLRLGKMMPRVLGGTIYRFAEAVMAESKMIVPVDTGTLRREGKVMQPQQSLGGVEVELGYGGAATAYAMEVHENLQMRHKEGKFPKYLETPFNAAAPQFQGTVAADATRALRGN